MIFVDTGVWYEANAEQGRLAGALQHLLEEHALDLATSVPVLTELWALLAARRNPGLATATCLDVAANAEVLALARDDHEHAVAVMRRWADQSFSYADAASCAPMARNKIETVLSLDDHFRTFRYGRRREQALHVLP